MSSSFRRSLPARPDLSQQKTLAKELLQSFNAGEAAARARIRAELPDKHHIVLADAQFVLAREYGFASWVALREHIGEVAEATRSPEERLRAAFGRHDAVAVRRLLESHPEFRASINAPLFAYNSPAIVAYANDIAMVNVLLDFGADPNRRSDWWAGGFHALHSATGAAAERLMAAGAIPDACAAAHLGRTDLLAQAIGDDPARVHERGGDGQTPLHFATSRAVIDLLLEAGADIDARDVDHRSTAAEWMVGGESGTGSYDLSRYLIERGASTDIFLATAHGLTDRVRAMLVARPQLLDLRTGRGEYAEQAPSSYHIYMWTIGDAMSPLDVARKYKQRGTLEMLLQFASPMQQLQLACRQGNEEDARALVRQYPDLIARMTEVDHRAITDAAWHGDARAVALMLDLGFDPRTPGHDSGTALHCAAWDGSAETVAVLLRHPDASWLVGSRDAHYNATPLGWCCHGSRFGNTRHDHVGVARLLLDAGARPGPDTTEASDLVEAVLSAYGTR